MATDVDLVPVRGSGDPEFTALQQETNEIVQAKKDISRRFREIGQRLKRVREKELYRSAGLHSFHEYLSLPAVDLSNYQAERLIQVAESQEVQHLLPLGITKIVEVLRIPPEQRQKLLSGPVEIGGRRKTLPEMSLAELRHLARDWRHSGKTRCDRCGRWVEQVKEIDGKFYGSDGPHSCYDIEMEERRQLSARPIPAPQLDTVLNTLRSVALTASPTKEQGRSAGSSLFETLDGFLHLYAQLLYQADAKQPPAEEAYAEAELLRRALRLLKVRLQDLSRP